MALTAMFNKVFVMVELMDTFQEMSCQMGLL
jgi:hypothetical protein